MLVHGNDTSLQECRPRYANEIAFFLYVYIALLVFYANWKCALVLKCVYVWISDLSLSLST